MRYRILINLPADYDDAAERGRFAAQMPADCLGVPWDAEPNEHHDRTGDYLAFYLNVEEPPDPPTLGALTTECAAIVAAYDPQQITAGERAQQERVASRSRWAALAALRGKSVAEIYDIVQARIDGWSSLAEAKADFREWMPLLVAAVAWDIMQDVNAEEG